MFKKKYYKNSIGDSHCFYYPTLILSLPLWFIVWQCSAHLCSCSIRLSLSAGLQKAFSLCSVILTTSIDPRVSLMATERAGSASLPFPLYCAFSPSPCLYRLHSSPARTIVYSSSAAHFCNRPSQMHIWEVRKGKTLWKWGFCMCMCASWWQPQHGSSVGGRCVFVVPPNPLLLPSPLSH